MKMDKVQEKGITYFPTGIETTHQRVSSDTVANFLFRAVKT